MRALIEVNLDVPSGQVTALVGDNGAGKMQLIKSISGIYQPDHGRDPLGGPPGGLPLPEDADRLGIETVYQDLALCDNLDIVQNMFLGARGVTTVAGRGRRWRTGRRRWPTCR